MPLKKAMETAESSAASWPAEHIGTSRSRATWDDPRVRMLYDATSLDTILMYLKASKSHGQNWDSKELFRDTSLFEAYMGVGVKIGEGNTFITEKRRNFNASGRHWIAVKRTKVSKADDQSTLAKRLQAALLEQHILSYYPQLSKHANIVSFISWRWEWPLIQSYQLDHGGRTMSIQLSLEYCELGKLSSYLQTSEVSDEQKWAFCLDISMGLEALHDLGISHGDMKLDNILVTNRMAVSTSTPLIAKISDFGSARLCEPARGADVSGGLVPFRDIYTGTPIYSPPEIHAQSLGDSAPVPPELFPYCDIFSFGLSCFEVFFNGERYTSSEHGGDLKTFLFSFRYANCPQANEPKIQITTEPIIEFARSMVSSLPSGQQLIEGVFERTLRLIPNERLHQGWGELRNFGDNLICDGLTSRLTVDLKEGSPDPAPTILNEDSKPHAEVQLDGYYNQQLGLLGLGAADMADDNDLLQLVVHGPISTNTDIPFPRTDALCRAFLQPYEDIVLGSKVRDLVGKANRGRISMGLAVSHAVGFFSNRSSVEQTLRWLEKAAEFGHSPALAYGSRAFEAHGRPVPSVFTRKSTTAFPSAHYSDMLRESWHRHIIDVDQRPILAVLGITLESNSSHAALTETAINLVKTSPSLWLLEGTWNFHRIHFFCMFGCLEETEDLISRDADCANFLSEPLKETPLIIACKNGHAEVALCLLRTGKVDSTATDVFGYNAFHYLLSLPAGKWKEVAEGLLAAAGDSQSEEPPFLQNADRITYIEPLFAELCGTPIEWAAMSGNWEMVQFFADKTDLSGILRQRIVLIGLRLALPELLECGLKLAIEMETLQAATRHEWDLDSVFEMNLFGRIGLGYSGVGCEGLAWTSKAIVMSPGMERMATLFTAWIAHGSNTKSKYIQCIETLVRFGLSIKDDIRRNRIGGSSVLRAIQSNNAMLVDILLSKGFPFTKSRTQDDRSKWAFLDFDGAVEFSQAQIAISIYLGGHPRHEPKEILPIFETLHKHGVLVPKEDDDYDFLSAAVNSEFRVAGTGSLDFLVQYLLDHGYAEVQRRKGSWWRLLGDAHSTTTLRALLENGGREYINARSIDGDRMVQVHGCNQSPASSTKPCCHHKHDCGTALFKILVDNVFEEYCREFLNYGAHAHLRGFHSHSILHRIIDFREAHAKVAAPFTWMDSLLQQKQLQVILNQTDYLDATVLQYATVYGDKYMVQSLLGGGADPSHFTSVPEACVLVSHSLRYPPWFVIPGDSPAFQRTCLFPTRSSADYREALKEILKLLLKAGSMNKQCLCPLCSGKHNPLNRLALTREANPTTLPADATVHTVFPRFFHRNDLEFVLLREKVEGRLTFAEMLRNQSQ